jgi:hypothetical protein
MGRVNEAPSADEPNKEFHPMNSLKKGLVGATAAAASIGLVGASTASAQPVDQDGLVNVFIDDTTVQVPIALAANICDVDVNVIASQATAGDTTCEALANAQANDPGRQDDRGPIRQSGLVNLTLTDTTVQVPVAAAINLCDVSVNILAQQLELGEAECTATADSIASRGAGN